MWKFLVCGILIHLAIFYSLIEVDFTPSEIVIDHSYSNKLPPPAKRVVLIVFDELSASSIWDENDRMRTEFEFLRNVIENNGTSAYVRVPNIRLETVLSYSSIFSGFWKNAIHFGMFGFLSDTPVVDTIMNETYYSWGFATNAIFKYFHKDGNFDTYWKINVPEYVSKFYMDPSCLVNHYVLNTFINQMNIFYNESLLNKNGILTFIEFKGLLSMGIRSGNFNPMLHNLDELLRQINKYISEYYRHDNKTVFIVTSYHNERSKIHSNKKNDRLLPLLMWGAGVRTGSDCKQQTEVKQIDISVLMATLLGVPIPKHSRGTVRTCVLNYSSEYFSESYYVNAKQLLLLFETEQNKKINNLGYIPYEMRKELIDSTLSEIRDLHYEKNYSIAINKSSDLIHKSLLGLKHVKSYYRSFYSVLITLIIVLWEFILVVKAIEYKANNLPSYNLTPSGKYVLFGIIGCISIFFFMFTYMTAILDSGLPCYYFYFFLLPQVLFIELCSRYQTFLNFVVSLMNLHLMNSCWFDLQIIFYFLIPEILVLAITRYRPALTISIVICNLWLFFAMNQCYTKSVPLKKQTHWIISSGLLAIFPYLDTVTDIVVRSPDLAVNLLVLGMSLWIFSCILTFFESVIDNAKSTVAYIFNKSSLFKNKKSSIFLNFIFKLQFIYILFASVIASSMYYNDIASEHRCCLVCLSWYLTVFSIAIIFLTPSYVNLRTIFILTSLAVPYILLSNAYEPLFYFIFVYNLLSWLDIERHLAIRSIDEHIQNKKIKTPTNMAGGDNFVQEEVRTTDSEVVLVVPIDKEKFTISIVPQGCVPKLGLDRDDLRRVVFFIHFIIVALFSTLTIEGMYNYNTDWSRLFLTVPSCYQLWMKILIITKYVIPVLAVFVVGRAIVFTTKISNIRYLSLAFQFFVNLIVIKVLLSFLIQRFFYMSILEVTLDVLLYVLSWSTLLIAPVLYFVALVLTNFQIR